MKFFAAILLAMLGCTPTFAADFPTKPIKIIVPYPPGGGTDVLTRITAKYLQESQIGRAHV